MYGKYISLLLFIKTVTGQAINGCPSYGCDPSGTFSFKLKVPTNASVAWISDFFIGPLPEGLGCVGNSNNLVCQYNSPREVGYISIDVVTGKLLWKDSVLRFPTLPIMDIYGDIIGSDGNSMVKYETNGKLDHPIIKLGSYIHPVYSLMVSDNSMVLIVSKHGGVISYQTNGIPDAAIWLNGTVERSNGTFIPIAQPVLAGNRAYILTAFQPDDTTVTTPSVLGMHRLYAIDIFDRMVDRLHITWYMNFEREFFPRDYLQLKQRSRISLLEKHKLWSKRNGQQKALKFRPNTKALLNDQQNVQPIVMFQSEQKTVYVYLPPPETNQNGLPFLWGLKDEGDDATLLFKIPTTVLSLSTYRMNDNKNKQSSNTRENIHKIHKNVDLDESSHLNPKLRAGLSRNRDMGSKKTYAETPLWAVSGNGESAVKLAPANGSPMKNVNVSSLLKTTAKVVSNLMVARESDSGSDVLITGISVSSNKNLEFLELCKQKGAVSNNTEYVIAFTEDNLLWMIATPNNTQVKGQIAGIPKPNPGRNGEAGDETRDELVVFAGTDEFSVVFSIH